MWHLQQNLFTGSQKITDLKPCFLKKMQLADWETKEAGVESLLRICVRVFAPILLDQRSSTVLAVHDVKMDGVLNQQVYERSAIGKNLCISYNITSTHDATKTLVGYWPWTASHGAHQQ